MRTHRLAIAALVMSLTLGACGSTPTASPAPAPSTPVATPAPTPTTAPTAPPPDVAALFAGQAERLDRAILTFSGTATVGLVQFTLTGDTTYTGVDSRGRTTTTVAGEPTVVEFVQVAGKRYVKNGDGPWLEAPIATSGDLAGTLRKAAQGSLSAAGTETRSGRSVHRLVPAAAAGFDPRALLGAVTDPTDLKVDLALLALEDGTPAGATVDASWTQADGESSVEARMTLDIGFGSVGRPQSIVVPDHVWTAFASTRYGVALAYPDDYEYEKSKGWDWFWAPDFGGIYLDRMSAGGYSLTTWGKGTVSYLKRELRNETVSNEGYTVDGVKARLITAIGKDKDGDEVTIYVVLAIKGKYVYDIEWVSRAGNAVVDLATFKQVLATFNFT